MRTLFTGLYCLLLFSLCAQRTVDVNKMEGVNESMFQSADGVPFVNVKFVRLVNGTPYFSDSWLKGSVVLDNEKIASGGFLKLDLFDNQLHYLNKDGKEMVATVPIKKISLADSTENVTYHFIHSSDLSHSSTLKQGWYLQLVEGRVSLFKFYSKAMTENKPYGYATVEQTIVTREQLFILKDNSLIEIKRMKDLPAALGSRKAELENYIKSLERKSGSVSDKLAAAVNFYNSLQ